MGILIKRLVEFPVLCGVEIWRGGAAIMAYALTSASAVPKSSKLQIRNNTEQKQKYSTSRILT
jgi:hypothetical protein